MTQQDQAGASTSASSSAEHVEGSTPSHRKLLIAVSGALLANFAALISGTMVINAMPLIVSGLDGSQSSYTWIIVGNSLMLTASMPIWGKLADQFNISRLLKIALALHVGGGILGAVAPSIEFLIATRAIQGLGIGGLSALTAVAIARLVPERERGRFAAYGQISWAAGTVSGPLIGGLAADTPLGWRGSFIIGLPIAVIALIIMTKTLRVPHAPRPVKIDYMGGALILATTAILLSILTLGGSSFAWLSSTTAILAGVAGMLLLITLIVETKFADEPIIRVGLFRSRTVSLAAMACAMVGVAMLAATIYLTEYYQFGLGLGPTEAGLLIAPMVCALAIAGMINGKIVSLTGRWKPVCIVGFSILITGAAMIGLADHSSPIWQVSISSAVLGIGMGMTTANLMVAVQSHVAFTEIGSATSLVSFGQSLGGSISVAVLGSLLGSRIAAAVPEVGRSLPHPSGLPPGLREAYQTAVGDNVTDLFWIVTPLAAFALICVLLIPETRLKATVRTDT